MTTTTLPHGMSGTRLHAIYSRCGSLFLKNSAILATAHDLRLRRFSAPRITRNTRIICNSTSPSRRGGCPMYTDAGKSAAGALASAVYLAGSLSFSTMAQGAPPNFAPHASVGWYAYNRQFIPPPSGPGPVQQDAARPYVSNDEFRVTGRQPTEQLADLNSPILQLWARDVLRKRNALVLSGKPTHPPHASCWPVGVPGFLLRPMTQAMRSSSTRSV